MHRLMHDSLGFVIRRESYWRVDRFKDDPSQWPEYQERPWRHRERRHPFFWQKYQRCKGFSQVKELFERDWFMVNRVFGITLPGLQQSLAEEHGVSMGSQEFEKLMCQEQLKIRQALAKDKALDELMRDLHKLTGKDLTTPSQRAPLLEAALAYLEHDFFDFISYFCWTDEDRLGWEVTFRDLMLHPERYREGLGKELLPVMHNWDFENLQRLWQGQASRTI